jgi:hypothetical protein
MTNVTLTMHIWIRTICILLCVTVATVVPSTATYQDASRILSQTQNHARASRVLRQRISNVEDDIAVAASSSIPPPYLISETDILYFDQQTNQVASDFSATSDVAWQQIAAWFADINAMRAKAAADISLLYAPNISDTVAGLILTPQCDVAYYSQYMNNATATLQYTCCQAQMFMYPGIIALAGQIFAHFMPSVTPTYTLRDGPAQIILNLHRFVQNEILAFHAESCIDDNRVIGPDRALKRMQEVQFFADTFEAFYRSVSIDAQGLSGCLVSNLCASNTTISQTPDRTLFEAYQINFPYQSVCSPFSLYLFEIARTATPC